MNLGVILWYIILEQLRYKMDNSRMDNLLDALTSKKFWYGVLGIVAILVSAALEISEARILEIGGIAIAMIIGQGVADSAKNGKSGE